VTAPRDGVNLALVRLVAGHGADVVTEWAATIAVLVYAFDQGGTRATGFASLAVLAPQLIGAPIAAALTNRFAARRLRVAALVVQAGAFAAAAVAASAEAPVAVVVLAAMVALLALSPLRPTGAVLLPGLVRSTRELTRGNLWIANAEAVSALAGPLTAAGLLALGGPDAALVGCAVLAALAAVLTAVGSGPAPVVTHDDEAWRPGPVLSGALHTLRERPWTIGVLGVVTARSAIVGFFDVVLVVLAFDELDLGSGGPGVLSALVGGGAMLSSLVATAVVRRTRLAPWLAIGIGLAAAACLVLAAATQLGVAIVVLPVLGVTSALLYGLGTILLQRSADPRVLGSMVALIELVGGFGLLVGSGLAQLLIAVGDVQVALVGMAITLGVVLVVAGPAAWRADAGADVPVVEMSVLHELPMFAPLPPLELEAVARSAVHLAVPAGEVVIREGDPGDRFYAVADGTFTIVRGGEHVRDARRGSCFGEVALLAAVPRTATVTATEPGELLAVDREPFLVALTGRGAALTAAWNFVQDMPVASELPSTPTVTADEPPSS
jgi:MFS family permease